MVVVVMPRSHRRKNHVYGAKEGAEFSVKLGIKGIFDLYA